MIDRDLRLGSDPIHARKSSIAYFRVPVTREPVSLASLENIDVPIVLTIWMIYVFCSEETSSRYRLEMRSSRESLKRCRRVGEIFDILKLKCLYRLLFSIVIFAIIFTNLKLLQFLSTSLKSFLYILYIRSF